MATAADEGNTSWRIECILVQILGNAQCLNVAVTRAKEAITVVSSIEPEELNVANTSQMGPKLLKAYLKYVRVVSNSQVDQIKAVGPRSE